MLTVGVCWQADYAALAKLYPEEEEIVTSNILAGWHGRGGAAEFIGVLAQALLLPQTSLEP